MNVCVQVFCGYSSMCRASVCVQKYIYVKGMGMYMLYARDKCE